MKKLFMILLVLTFMTATGAMAGDEALRKALINQGVISASAIDKEEIESLPATDWRSILSISGAVEGTVSWQEHRDDEKKGDSTSDAVMDTVEIGIEAAIADWITGEVILLAEDLGSDDETSFDVDEALITLQKESNPFYLVAGKRVQPFGVLPENFITDPIGMDAYETNEAGITLGLTGPMDLDLSATVYRGEEMMNHLFESGLFNTDEIMRATDAVSASETDDLQSYILAASIAPLGEKLVLGASYISEPGHSDRNNTVGLSVSSTPIEILTVNLEYFFATKRENYYNSTPTMYTDEFKEKVLFVEAVVQATDTVTVAAKYEHFDDDDMADKSSTWSVKDRYSLAAFWTFFENENLAAFTGVEWRHSEHEVDSTMKSSVADDNNEVFGKLGIEF